MIAIPAMDLRAGACVQLGGDQTTGERLDYHDPLGAARTWAQYGFRMLHVVDADAAAGRGTNADVIRDLLGHSGLDLQIGGGVRSGDTIEQLLAEGATRVVVGPRAIEEPSWLEGTADTFPNTLVVAVDVRDRRVVSRGWERTLARNVFDLVEELNDLPLACTMVTALHREGQLLGTDLALMEDAAELSRHPLIAAGGITALHELRILSDAGVYAAVIGLALYRGTLDARAVADEFAA